MIMRARSSRTRRGQRAVSRRPGDLSSEDGPSPPGRMNVEVVNEGLAGLNQDSGAAKLCWYSSTVQAATVAAAVLPSSQSARTGVDSAVSSTVSKRLMTGALKLSTACSALRAPLPGCCGGRSVLSSLLNAASWSGCPLSGTLSLTALSMESSSFDRGNEYGRYGELRAFSQLADVDSKRTISSALSRSGSWFPSGGGGSGDRRPSGEDRRSALTGSLWQRSRPSL